MTRVSLARRAMSGHLGLVYLFLYGPVAVLVALSFNESGLPTAWTGFSVEWYGKMLANAAIRAAVVNTLIVASASTAIATAIGTLLALGLERLRPSAVALDCEDELDGVEAILKHGTSADRQTRSYQLALASGATPDAAVMRVASDLVQWSAAA